MRYTYILILFCLIPVNFSAQGSNCFIKEIPFKDGEEFTFIVSYNWFLVWPDVGLVTFTTEEKEIAGKKVFHFLGVGNTLSNWDWFFKVRDRYETWMNSKTLKPYYFNRRVREGDFALDIQYNFKHDKDHALCTYKKNDNKEEYDTIKITDCTFDIMSILCYARTLDFSQYKTEEKVPLTVLLDKELENVYFRYKGIENVKIRKIGEFECIKLSIMVVAGTVFKDGGETLNLWISNDKNKIPVYVESPIILGSVKGRLASFKNLKYPLTSLKNKD